MKNPFSIEGKTILVTGASSGIGAEIAVELAGLKANVIITGRNKERLANVYNLLDKSAGQIHKSICVDLSTNDGVTYLSSTSDNLDGIVFCAGINDKSLFKYINREKIEHMFNVNVFAPALLAKELYKQNKIRQGASLVFISSISATYATVSNLLYASSKGAINSLIRVLALELANKNIRVNGIMPGMVNTKMIQAYGLSEEELSKLKKSYPLGRLGEPVDIANAVTYYLSNASSWVTGSNIVVDGGITLR